MKNYIYILLSILFFEQSVFAQKFYTINDTKFKSCLKISAPTTINSFGQIDTALAMNFSGSINCPFQFIKSIDGLQYYKSVTSIDISANEIDTLEKLVSTKFNNLVDFNCSNNKNITTIFPLSNAPKLKDLKCSLNRIKSLEDLNTLSSLINLDAKNNLLESVSFHPLSQINIIDLRVNNIKTLPNLSTTNYNSLKSSGLIYLSDNYINFEQLSKSLLNIYEPIAKNRFNVFDFNSQNELTFLNGNEIKFDEGDTITLKLNYKAFNGDQFVWRLNGFLLPQQSANLPLKLTKASVGEYFCEIQNNNIIQYSGLTLSTVKIKLTLKVNICPDIKNIQIIKNPSLCNKNEIIIKGFQKDYVYSIQNLFGGNQIISQDSIFSNLADGKYKLTINNLKNNCVVDTTNFQIIDIKSLTAQDFAPTTTSAYCVNKGRVLINKYVSSFNYKLVNILTKQVYYSQQNNFENLVDGNYIFIVYNATCADTLKNNTINILGLNANNYILSTKKYTCENQGIVTINNYNSLFNYKLMNTLTKEIVNSNQSEFTNLKNGDYFLIVENPFICADTSDNSITIKKSFNASDYLLNILPSTCVGKGEIVIQNYDSTYKYFLVDSKKSVFESLNDSFKYLSDGEYTFYLQNKATSCIDSLNQNSLKISSLKAEDFKLTVEDATCDDDGKVEISVNYNPNYLYFLTNKITGSTINAQNGKFNSLKQGDYYFSVNNQLGTCVDTLKITVVSINKAGNCGIEVTPNGDGLNDNLTILEKGNSKIFDRNGNLVFELLSPAEWNCTNKNGELVTSGVYMLYTDGIFIKSITVFR